MNAASPLLRLVLPLRLLPVDALARSTWTSLVLVGLGALFLVRLREQWRPPREVATSSVEGGRGARRRLVLQPAMSPSVSLLLAATCLLLAGATIVARANTVLGDQRLRGWSDLDWTIRYDGYGQVSVAGDTAILSPRPARDQGQTSAVLALAGKPTWGDYQFTVRMQLDRQLRQNTPPNPWEAGWLIFRYREDGQAYYLAHKPNGLELGKLVPPIGQGQEFLATTSGPPAEPGRWYSYRIDAVGPRIRVYLDDQLQIDFTDPNPILHGRVGLYCEDARVLYQHPTVTTLEQSSSRLDPQRTATAAGVVWVRRETLQEAL